jgi:hypothetical protein
VTSSTILRDGVLVAHVFTTAVMCGLSFVSALVSLQPTKPAFLWYAGSWPFKSGPWAIMLGLIALVGIVGGFAMAGAFRRNKYLILASTTVVAAGHAHVAQTIWDSYHLATGTTTYPLIFGMSAWVFWRTSTEHTQ